MKVGLVLVKVELWLHAQWSEKILRQAGVTVTLAALMDAILVYVYMKWAHPWGPILENVTE